ncbi:MAG: DUF952 domain-containing protein [Eubacterium sp.]|nr:DUF952 domain-containing protein [Eubacterium sp.]
MILHCMKEKSWSKVKNKKSFGKKDIKRCGFIHCSTIEYFWRVAPNFKNVDEPLVLICIDETKLTSEVRYEDSDNCGRCYPHVYGEINIDSVVQVLPFLRDSKGDYIKNSEFDSIENQ